MRFEFISPEYELNAENDNADVLLYLDDGRVFGLFVATPNNVYRCMDNEANDYYFGVPPLFVRRLDRKTVELALKALLQEPKWLETYGTLQQ